MIPWGTIVPYAGCLILGTLLLKAHQDLGEAVGNCNADKALAISEAQEITRVAERENADRALAQQAAWAETTINAVQEVSEARVQAAERSAQSERAVFQTTLERFDEELVDSGACLSVFVLESDVRGLRLNANR